MPVEMEREGRRLMASAKISDFNKSPMSTQKSYSIKKNFTDHDQAFRSSGSAIEDLFSKKKGKMSPNLKGKDVLNRLDSLVAGDKQEVTSECKGILKQKSTQLNTRRKKRHIRFPDSKKIQEIIGWDVANLNRYKFKSNLIVHVMRGYRENALIKTFELSPYMICLQV